MNSVYWQFIEKNKAIGCQSAASLAQSAARQSHNLKVVSSSLTGGTFFEFFSANTLAFESLLQLTFPTPVVPVKSTECPTSSSRSIRNPYRFVSIVGTKMSKNGVCRFESTNS